jgi:hypothetical protein
VGCLREEFDKISFGIPSVREAVPVPSEWTVVSNVLQVIISARAMVRSPRGVVSKGHGFTWASHGQKGSRAGGAGEFFVAVGVTGGYDFMAGLHYFRIVYMRGE